MFDREFKGMKSTFGVFAVLAIAANLVFWLGLIYGAFAIARHFGILAALGVS